MKKQGIGIIDSGIGGFTVAKSLKALLPQEDILYLGDGANAPYGNRSQEELVSLAKYMINFMNQGKVKLLLVACNTISCLAQQYESEIQCPVLYVVRAGAMGVAQAPYQKIGVMSTVFTHKQGIYGKYIQEIAPEKEVISTGSTHLVRLLEESAPQSALEQEIKQVLSPLVAQGIEVCVLGCTHYPLAEEALHATFPTLPFSDPAEEMARQAKGFLTQQNLLNPEGGKLTVYTTGEVSLQAEHLKRAGLVADSLAYLNPLIIPSVP